MEKAIEPKKNDKLKDLLSFIDQQEIEDHGIEEDDSFEIITPDQAEYYIKKLKESQQEMEEINNQANNYLQKKKEQIELWRDNQLKPHKNLEEYYAALLENYAKNQLKGQKKKSLKMIEGTLQFRSGTKSYDYDESTIMEHINNKIKATEIPTESIESIIETSEDGEHVIPLEKLNELIEKAYDMHFLKLKKSLSKTDLKKELTEKDGYLYWDGEKVPGVKVEPGEEKFSVK